MTYAKKRYITYILITIFTLGLPFITIDGNHMLLLSFEKQQFHFLGFAFNVNELFIMPFLLMVLFIGIFATTAMFGRLWCGWACPQTIFRVIYRDLIEGTLLDLNKIKNKQKSADLKKGNNMIKKVIAISLWSILCVLISINFIWYFVPPEDFFTYMKNPSEHIFMILFILSIAGFLVFNILLIKESFCVYVCPYSRVQSVLYDDDTKQVIYNTNRGGNVYNKGEKSITSIKQWSNNEECTTCEACVKVCPTHIDIRKGLQVECINCLECSDACSKVMGMYDKPSLIQWGSTNSVLNEKKSSIFTKRNIMYIASILLAIVFAFGFAKEQEPILASVNKTTKLYSIKNSEVSNNYIILINNKQDKKLTFNIKIDDNRFEVKRFNPIKLSKGKKGKSVLVVKTKKRLFLSDKKNSILNIKATIFAKEDPSINIQRVLSFTNPRNDLTK